MAASPNKQRPQPDLDFDFMEPPVIEMEAFLDRSNSERWNEECRKLAFSFHKFGICVVRDPRVNHQDNDTYIDMVENYFEVTG